MARGDPSPTDRDAVEFVRRAGYDVTARQLEDWRAVGVIPRAIRGWPGRGSISHYQQEQLEWITAAAALAPTRAALYERVLWLFILGYPVDEPALKRAHRDLIEVLQTSLAASADSTLPEEQADRFASDVVLGRARGPAVSDFKRNARRAHKRLVADGFTVGDIDDEPTAAEVLQLTAANLLMLATTGVEYTPEGPEAVLATYQTDDSSIAPEAFAAAVSRVSVARIAEVLDVVPYDALVTGARVCRESYFETSERIRDCTFVPPPGLLLFPLLIAVNLSGEASFHDGSGQLGLESGSEKA